MSQLRVPLNLETGNFPSALPLQLVGAGLDEQDWLVAVGGLNDVLTKSGIFSGQMVASFTVCCILILDLPLFVLLIASQLGRWFDHWYENYFFWAALSSSVFMLCMMSYMRRNAAAHELMLRSTLMQANTHLLPKMVQVALVEDPQSVLALEVSCGVTQPILEPLQFGYRRMERVRNPYMGAQQTLYGDAYMAPGVARGQPFAPRSLQAGSPNGSGTAASTVMGRPVSSPGTTASAPPANMLTIQIPEQCAPGGTFQFTNPSTGEVMQAQRPLDGARIVQVQSV